MRRHFLSLVLIFFSILLSGVRISLAQSISIFGEAVPSNAQQFYARPITFGVKFWSTEAGTISAILFYRDMTSPQGYVASLYSADGTLLASVTMATESGPVPGWQGATLASPIPISPNTTYIAAYYVPSGGDTGVPYGLSQGVTIGPLTAPASSAVGGNGVYSHCQCFPTSTWEATNFLADVLFTPAAPTAYLTLSLNPANPTVASNAPAGTVVATITASWSDGSPFTGTLSFGPPYFNDQGVFAISGNSLIIDPSGPGLSNDANTVQDLTIVATQ
jgi:Domain of unknown function (DUF4082)